jgi:hypothetical protein
MWPNVLFSARVLVRACFEFNLYALLDDHLAIHDHPVAREWSTIADKDGKRGTISY